MADTISTEGSIVLEANAEQSSGSLVFFFTYLNDETVSLQADITDNFVETNYSVQDHIALKPRTIRLKGLIGEIVYEKNKNPITNEYIESQINIARSQNQNFINTISNSALLTSLIPTLGSYTSSAINAVKQVISSIKRYQGIWRNFKRVVSGNSLLITTPYTPNVKYDKQKAIIEDLTYIFNKRIPVTLANFAYWQEGNSIDTSLWYIQAINARQSDSLYVSDLEVVLKEIRIAETKFTKLDSAKYANPTQKTDVADKGNAPKKDVVQEAKEKISEEIQFLKEEPARIVPRIFGIITRGITSTIKKVIR